VPALLLFCGSSPVNHAQKAAQRCRDVIPNATVDVISDSGHMLPVEQPALFAGRVLDFVSGLDGAGG
jgi:pimeloyl-ACP methyl ester carboxylesterase